MILTKSIVLMDNSKHSAIATMKQNGNNIDVSVKNINIQLPDNYNIYAMSNGDVNKLNHGSSQNNYILQNKSLIDPNISIAIVDSGAILASGGGGKVDVVALKNMLQSHSTNCVSQEINNEKLNANICEKNNNNCKEFEEKNAVILSNENNNNFSNIVESTLDKNSNIENIENSDSTQCSMFDDSVKQAKLFESTDKEIDETIDKEIANSGDFFELISEQIDELFDKYPEEEKLSQIIPSSKWVKVDWENNGKYYVIGLIYEFDVLKYVCYGVPVANESDMPAEFENVGQWVPIDNWGYYIMYQDAVTGDTIKID